MFVVVFFKQKTAYEMRISDWSSDVCSSDLGLRREIAHAIDIDRALAVEAADEGPVADRVAAFGRAEGDTGHGAQRILERCRTGLLDHLAGKKDRKSTRLNSIH